MEKNTSKPFKIALVGPESTGKTELTKELALFFKEPYVAEYARAYLHSKARPYTPLDLDIILAKQILITKEQEKNATQFIFCDTSSITIKIWSQLKYSSCSSFILNTYTKESIALYLLCYPDLDYEDDDLREDPDLSSRLNIFKAYQDELNSTEAKYFIVKGKGQKRIKNAISAIQEHFSI